MGELMAGYFKDTRHFYRALWAWLEIQKYTNSMPQDAFGDSVKTTTCIEAHTITLLGYVRGWPDMPELGEGYKLFKKAKELALNGNTNELFECRMVLLELKNYMVSHKLR